MTIDEGRPMGQVQARTPPQGAVAGLRSYGEVAVLIPCFNEEAAIAKVVREFRVVLPGASVYVYDNNSTDRTREVAAEAGAVVRSQPLQGKGRVVRRMFTDIDAAVYLLVDGDGTYDAASAPLLIERLESEQLDMVVGVRVSPHADAYRRGHRFGNALLTGAVARLFGRRFTDMLSGYRAFSRRFVKSFPAAAKGFEIETEFTVHALELELPVAEVDAPYGARPEGSVSKLRTFADGWKILRLITWLYKDERPLRFFGVIGAVLVASSLALGLPVVFDFLRTGLVQRQPTAILATGLALLAALSFVCGLILDTVTLGRKEAKRLAYLALPR